MNPQSFVPSSAKTWRGSESQQTGATARQPGPAGERSDSTWGEMSPEVDVRPKAQGYSVFPDSRARQPSVTFRGTVDELMIQRALTVSNELDLSDEAGCVLGCEAMRAAVSDMWPSAIRASRAHASIVGMLESSLLQTIVPSAALVDVWREALRDLTSTYLAEGNLKVLRSRFLAAGHSPMALFADHMDGAE